MAPRSPDSSPVSVPQRPRPVSTLLQQLYLPLTGGTQGKEKGKQGLGSTTPQDDEPRPALRAPAALEQPASRLPHRCAVRGADAGRLLVWEGEETPSLPGLQEPSNPTPIPSQEGSFLQRNSQRPSAAEGSRKKRELKLRIAAREPGVGGFAPCGPQPLRPLGTIKLSKVWRQLGDKKGIPKPKLREGPDGAPRQGGSQHPRPDTCLGAPHLVPPKRPGGVAAAQLPTPSLPSLSPPLPNTPPRAPVTPPLRAGRLSGWSWKGSASLDSARF